LFHLNLLGCQFLVVRNYVLWVLLAIIFCRRHVLDFFKLLFSAGATPVISELFLKVEFTDDFAHNFSLHGQFGPNASCDTSSRF